MYLKSSYIAPHSKHLLFLIQDENYAREIMQLFTIGLQEINMDGSVIYEGGIASDTYDVDDIISYSRAWTGLSSRDARGGSVDNYRNGKLSLDPLRIEPSKRDPLPKSDLLNGFIGDKSPLCTELPAKHFTRKGATYKVSCGPYV